MFKGMEYVYEVYKEKSFSKAADATFLTQPTISTHVGNLEAELGVRLLNRKGREISLTHEGQEFYSYAMELLNTRERAINQLHSLSKEPEGILEIQTSSIPGHSFLPKLMDEFHKKNPKIRFYVEQTDSRTVNDNLLSQRGEIGFTGYKGSQGLIYEPVFYDEMVLITPDIEKYRSYKNGEEITVELFIDDPFVLREDGSGTKQEMEKALIEGKAVFRDVDVVARMTNMSSVKQVVSRGLGISIVSEQVVKDSAELERIRYFRIKGLEKKRCFYVAYHRSAVLSPAAEAFLQFVHEVI